MGNNTSADKINPVFIVGNPRSGTTFLQLLLTAHPSFSSSPETHYFTYVLDFLDIWNVETFSIHQLDTIFSRLAEKPDIKLSNNFKTKIMNKTKKGKLTPSVFLNDLMLYFALKFENKTSKRWVEKTPKHALHINKIFYFFPNAKILNIIRDPRCVVSSNISKKVFKSEKEKRLYFYRKSMDWKKRIKQTDKFTNDKNILTIRYEDIIFNPEKYLKKIMIFLNEKYDPKVLKNFSKSYDKVVLNKENSWKKIASTGKIIDRRNIWKKRMSRADAEDVEIICEEFMYKYNYILKRLNLYRKIKKYYLIFYFKVFWINEVILNFKSRYINNKSFKKLFIQYLDSFLQILY